MFQLPELFMSKQYMKKICIGVPIMNRHELTVEFLKLLNENTAKIDEIIIVDNGSETDLLSYEGMQSVDSRILNALRIIKNEKNVGVRDAINQIWKATDCEYIFLTHNDVLILEHDWDTKVRTIFENLPETGIVGCYGSKMLGTADIYKTPYRLNQLARGGNVSGSSMDKSVHGFRGMATPYENVATFDGFAMIVKKEIFDKICGLSTDILEIHHMYDQYICTESLKLGYENIVIPLNFFHKGGQTDTSQDWSKETGKSKQQVHEDAHPKFYNHYKGVLPIIVEDIFNESTGLICGYSLYMDNKLVKERIY